MANHKPDNAEREYFTLGEHLAGTRHYRFRYNGRTYLILEQTVSADGEHSDETVRLEEADAKKAYEAWNHIKRPERYGV